MSSAGTSPSYVVVLEHELVYGYETYFCEDIKTAKAVLDAAYRAGARVVRVTGGCQAAAQSPLDITVLTDTDDLPF